MRDDYRPATWSGGGKKTVQANPAKTGGKKQAAKAEDPPAPTIAEPMVGTDVPADGTMSEEIANDGSGEALPPVQEVDATEAAAELAAEHNIALETVEGTGTEGRITKDDVAALVPDNDS